MIDPRFMDVGGLKGEKKHNGKYNWSSNISQFYSFHHYVTSNSP